MLVREHPGLARARIGDPACGQSQTLLHVVCAEAAERSEAMSSRPGFAIGAPALTDPARPRRLT